MKSTRGSQIHAEDGNLSIPAAEEMVEEALNELAFTQDPGLVRALRFLAPPGYQAIVELCSENGRSKRRDASADSWSPEYDEVRIYFERIEGDEPAPRPGRATRGAHTAGDEDEAEPTLPADMDARVKELCTARDRRAAACSRTRRSRLHRAQVVSRFFSAAQDLSLEPAS